MSWAADLSPVLILVIHDPTVIALCALAIFFAGALAGHRARVEDEQLENIDAGDTHASIDWLEPTPAIPTRRVRAIGEPLKPSYDSRKHAERH